MSLLATPGPRPHHRAASKRAVRISLGIVGTLFLAEVVGGWLTNSLALLADAGHLLTDLGALALVLMAFWFAARPASPTRTYGYHRIEILAALANGLTLWAIAAYILFQAYRRLAEPPEVLSGPMIIIALVGLLGQIAAAMILRASAKDSLNVHAAFLHVATDAVQSIGIIVAGLLMLRFGWYIADPIISAIIALLIIYTGGRIVLQATHVLLEASPSDLDVVALQESLWRVQGVQSVHDLHVWTITSGYHAMSAHVVLTDSVTPQQGQRVLAQLRDVATHEYGIGHVTIQIDGGSLKCQEDHALSGESTVRVP